jgi:hypothetical protein
MSFHLYIKRAEMHHNLEYIKCALKMYGIVKDVALIQKESNGKKYNGVIVYMDSWKSGKHVDKLFKDFNETSDNTSKIFHNQNYYWYVKIYDEPIPKCIESEVNNDAQILFMQQKLEKMEQRLMENERQRMYEYLLNKDLEIQLIEKEMEYKRLLNEMEEKLRLANII